MSLSVITRIVSYPLDLCSVPTKSNAISVNRFSGTGIEWSNPTGHWVEDLFHPRIGIARFELSTSWVQPWLEIVCHDGTGRLFGPEMILVVVMQPE